MSYQVLAPQPWARREFGSVQLKDKRLNKRVVQVASAMAADPSASIPKQNKKSAQRKGAYRLFDHERACLQSLCNPRRQHIVDDEVTHRDQREAFGHIGLTPGCA